MLTGMIIKGYREQGRPAGFRRLCNRMKRVAYIVRLLITAVLLLYVLQKVGLFDAASRAELFTLIGSVKIPLLLLSVAWITISLLIAVLASLAITSVIVDERPYIVVKTWLQRRISFLVGKLGKLDKIHGAVLEYRDDRKALLIALINTFVFYLLAVINVYVTALALSTALLMRFKSFFDAGLGGVLYPMFSPSLPGDRDQMLEEKDN